MQITFISPDIQPISDLITGLVKKGHTLGIFAPENQRVYLKPGIPLQFYTLPSLPDMLHSGHQLITAFPTAIPALLSKFHPEIVHFFDPQFSNFYSIYLWCKFNHIPLICSQQNNSISFLSTSLYSQSDLFISTTDIQAANLKKTHLKVPTTLIKNNDLISTEAAYRKLLTVKK